MFVSLLVLLGLLINQKYGCHKSRCENISLGIRPIWDIDGTYLETDVNLGHVSRISGAHIGIFGTYLLLREVILRKKLLPFGHCPKGGGGPTRIQKF